MALLWNMKKKKAVQAFKTQFGIDLYEDGHLVTEKEKEYDVYIAQGSDFVAVVNRKRNDKLVAKEWYVFDKRGGWIKKGSLDREQSLRLYADTKPNYFESVMTEYNWQLPLKAEESMICMICDEYISSYMTKCYFGFDINVGIDSLWERGSIGTEALYMPHRNPPPREKTAAELKADQARLDKLLDEIVDLL